MFASMRAIRELSASAHREFPDQAVTVVTDSDAQAVSVSSRKSGAFSSNSSSEAKTGALDSTSQVSELATDSDPTKANTDLSLDELLQLLDEG